MGIVSKKRVQVLTFASLLVAQLVLVALCEAADTEIRSKSCNGSIAECYREEEFFMDSETSRRILVETNFISGAALDKNNPVGVGKPVGEHQPNTNRACLNGHSCRTRVYNG